MIVRVIVYEVLCLIDCAMASGLLSCCVCLCVVVFCVVCLCVCACVVKTCLCRVFEIVVMLHGSFFFFSVCGVCVVCVFV